MEFLDPGSMVWGLGFRVMVQGCPVLGCVVAVAGIAEVPWEVPWRPLLLGGNLFEECRGDPQGWAGHVFGMADAQGCQLVFPSLRGG